MKKKNAFTLIELLITISVILVISLLVSPKIISTINNNRNKAYYEIERRLEEAAAKYIINEYVSSDVTSIMLSKQDLINSNYIEEVVDLKKEESCDAYVYVYNLDSIAEYDAVLNCPSYKTKAKNAAGYINYLYLNEEDLNNGLYEPLLDDGTSTGIRYRGANPNNKVYFNCKDKDASDVTYGESNYDYANSCEIWRIIGVFDVEDGKGNVEKRIKLLRDSLPVRMSFDSSAGGVDVEDSINYGEGINQWGESTYEDGSTYEGSDLMQMLNGYYIGKDPVCNYCNGVGQSTCENVCTSSITPLSSNAQNMIGQAVWSTGGRAFSTSHPLIDMYRAERSLQTGKTCTESTMWEGKLMCTDKVNRTTEWIGLVGLIYPSDYGYASGDSDCSKDVYTSNSTCKNDNWLHGEIYNTLIPRGGTRASDVWRITDYVDAYRSSDPLGVRPSLYLSSDVQITGGDGNAEPYKLK